MSASEKSISRSQNVSAAQFTTASQMRQSLLNSTMIIGAAFAVLVIISNGLVARDTGQWWTFLIYGPAVVAIVIGAIFRRIPYSIRSHTFAIALYLVGMTALFTYGISSAARSFLVFVPILAALLLGLRSSLLYLVLCGVGWGVYAYLALTGVIEQGTSFQHSYMVTSSAWLTGGLTIVALAAVGAVSSSYLLKNLESSLNTQKDLNKAVEAERASLEVIVQERTQDIERRLVQIRTAGEISQIISAFLDPEELLRQVASLVKERFDLYYVGIFLLDEYKDYAVLKAGTGEAGQQMIARGHKLAFGGTSMVGWACQNRKARIALDTGIDAVRFNNPYLPDARSELALPLIRGEQILGAISIQSDKPSAFDENDITLLQSIADSLATALENAQLYKEAKTNLEEIRELQRQYLSEAWQQSHVNEMTFEYEDPLFDETAEDSKEYSIPLKLRGQDIGRLVMETTRQVDEQELALAGEIASEAAIALENARLVDEIRLRSQQERLVSQITVKAQGSLDLDTVIRTSVQELGKTINARKVQIRLKEKEGSTSGTNGNEESRS